MKKLISILSAICMVVTMIPFSAYAADITPEISLEEFSQQLSEMNEEYADEPVSNRLIVKSEKRINQFNSVDIVEGYDDLHIVQFDNSESAEQALEYYNDSKYVEYVEEDMTISISETETSDAFTYDNHLSWGSSAIGVDDYFDYLGDITALPEVIVGIIDTGIDLDHEFLKGRIIETSVNYSSTGKTNSENDDNGHGTHVAGIVVDNTPENVKIKAFKCMNNRGSGNISDVCLAVNAAVENNVDVINMSLGARGTSKLMEDTINSAVEQGITVCVAAGNNGFPAANYTPANIENCITVGAVNEEDQKPLWSNYGDAVDIWAPGSSIYSTYNDGGYKSLSGTSMACPFVAASSALLLSNNKSLNPKDIKDLIVSNSRLLEDDFLGYDLYALYIGVLSDYKGERTAKPVFSIEGGIHLESITLEITCPDEDAEIYYSTNGKRASQDNGILYTGPITLDKVTTLNACAYKEGKLKSLMTTETYNIVSTDPDENFDIDSNGIITKYNGSNSYLSIPETINGITVKGIGNQAFRFKKIVILKMPDTLESIDFKAFSGVHGLERIIGGTLKKIGEFAFYQCENLRDIDLSNVEYIDNNAFLSCYSLEYCDSKKLTYIGSATFSSCDNLMYINAPNCETLGRQAFMGCTKAATIILPKIEKIYANTFDDCRSLTKLHLDNLKFIAGSDAFRFCILLDNIDFPLLKGELPNNTFYGCYNIENINIPNIISIENNAFEYCFRLKSLYIPSVQKIGEKIFSNCSNIENIYAPQLTSTQSLPFCDNVNIYLSNKFSYALSTSINKYKIIAPSGSYAEQWAKDSEHTFIPSDYRDESIENPANVTDLGRSIRVTDAGLRFGFSWNAIPEIEELATNIEYGFIYSLDADSELKADCVDNKTVYTLSAPNRINHGEYTTFNLVLTDIPKASYNQTVYARAYVNIDGMYFYSNPMNGSFNEVANLVLADDEIDSATKDKVTQLLNG